MPTAAADIPTDLLGVAYPALADFCRRNGVRRLSLFGSHLKGTARPDSDVDLLVEFLPGWRISLFDIGGMIADLSDLFGREVDLRSAKDLSPLFRDRVVKEARLIYAAE